LLPIFFPFIILDILELSFVVDGICFDYDVSVIIDTKPFALNLITYIFQKDLQLIPKNLLVSCHSQIDSNFGLQLVFAVA
jgi:hypothetical protein